ncbi:hydrogen peroxide-inducible genes activator [Amylibacter sp. IMCC11727]|uniref:hydrogen peroxide-inducible genes activator n=1 Tax=Amylibacter sp. IMCC11727 TaxID=3039851 RepID=UPI00244E1096|nr:hydrogen peroxide-inducible genes activator [Amylibacter sp. IMCC11727]WGI21693.1 LysR substrate-binding domain-containing protein [Amylibacter sp. IMCC11727]
MKITLRQLQYFQSLCKHGHFGHAAAASNVSQPALSVQIQELEDLLGKPLINRDVRPFCPTPFGHEILKSANRILADVQALEDSAHLNRGVEGPFHLGVIPTVAPYLLPTAIRLIQDSLPKLDLQIREATTDVLLGEITSGQLDAAIIATDVTSPDLTQRPLFQDRFLLAVQTSQSESLGLTDGQIVLEDIAPLKLLLLAEGHCLRDQTKSFCQYATQETLNQIGASSLHTLAGLVAGGYGTTLLPEIAFTDTEGRSELTILRLAEPCPDRTVSLVMKTQNCATMDTAKLEQVLADAGTQKTTETRTKLIARK